MCRWFPFRCHCGWLGCLLVLFHDFLDHVDGIVAKIHRESYGSTIDDGHYGAFLDAFCDKIVNVTSLWTILLLIDLRETSFLSLLFFVGLCYTIIALEVTIGVVRIQDYFREDKATTATKATMEGKLKEKLESIGLAFLCLATGYRQPLAHWTTWTGIICFLLTIRLALASLNKKIASRTAKTNNS